MKPTLFLHFSRLLPNAWGQPQVLLPPGSDQPLLPLIVALLQHSKALRQIRIVCSDRKADADLETWLSDALARNRETDHVPVEMMRMPSDQPGTFEGACVFRNNQRPHSIQRVAGLYHTEACLAAMEKTRCETAILAWAECIPLLMPWSLDTLIQNRADRVTFLSLGDGDSLFAILPARRVRDVHQEVLSEHFQQRQLKLDQLTGTQEPQNTCHVGILKEQREYLESLWLRPQSISLWSGKSETAVLPKIARETGLTLNPGYACATAGQVPRVASILETLHRLIQDTATLPAALEFLTADTARETCTAFDNLVVGGDAVAGTTPKHLVWDGAASGAGNNRGRTDDRSGSVKDFQALLDSFPVPPQAVTFRLEDSPLSHPHLEDWLRMARSKGIPQITLQTKTPDLAMDLLSSRLADGLNTLLLEVSPPGSPELFACLDRLIAFRKQLPNDRQLATYLQIRFQTNARKFIVGIYHRYLYRLDGITVLPSNPAGENPVLPLSPPVSGGNTPCYFATATWVCHADGSFQLCEEHAGVPLPDTAENRKRLSERIGRETECASCTLKNRVNGFGTQPFPPSLLLDPTATEGLLARILSSWWHTRLLKEWTGAEHLRESARLLNAMDQRGILPDAPLILDLCRAVWNAGERSTALDLLEVVLKSDPANAVAHTVLDAFESQLSRISQGGGHPS